MAGRVVTWSVAAALGAGLGLAACGSPTARDGAVASPVPGASLRGTSSSTAGAPASAPSTDGAPASPGGGTASAETAAPASAPGTAAPTATRPPAPRISPGPASTWVRSPARTDGCALAARYRGQDVEVVPTASKIAVLTFDGGSSSSGVTSVLSTLATKHAAATFFLTGDFARTSPGASASIGSAHPVGNHTDTHPDLTTLSSTAVVDEIRDGAAAIRAATGGAPGPWFRFPYGARDARTIDLVNDECYVAVRWSVDSLGWKGTSGGMTTATVRDRVLAAARPGMIVLMHLGAHPTDGTTLDAAALPAVIDGLRAKGYSFVTLPQAL